MNSSSHLSPGLVCRLVRWRAALTDSAAPVAGHGATCPSCRAYFQTATALESRLHRDARTNLPAPSEGFERRIIAAVHREQTQPHTTTHRPFPRWSFALAGATAALALVLVLARNTRTPATAASQPSADAAAVLAAAGIWGRDLRNTLAPQVARLSEPDPLGLELRKASVDARSALSFLAANFLPTERGLEPRDASSSPSS
jgi:hypothetical protein